MSQTAIMPAIETPDALPPWNERIEALEAELLPMQQRDLPLKHLFAPGVYYREIFMPADTFVIGHCHKTEHFNVVLTGRARVMMNGEIYQIIAPCVLKSGVNVRKLLYIEEDMRWATIHPTDETDLEKLEEMLIIKSAAFTGHHEFQKLRQHIAELKGVTLP